MDERVLVSDARLDNRPDLLRACSFFLPRDIHSVGRLLASLLLQRHYMRVVWLPGFIRRNPNKPLAQSLISQRRTAKFRFYPN